MADQIAGLLCDTREFKHIIDIEESGASPAGPASVPAGE
jgi:hypothetical protein